MCGRFAANLGGNPGGMRRVPRTSGSDCIYTEIADARRSDFIYTGIADARISDFIYTESAESGGLDLIYTEMRRAGGAAKPESRDAQLMLSRTQTHARTHTRTPAA